MSKMITRDLEEKKKGLKSFLLLFLTIAAFQLTGPAARADSDPLTITLESPFQSRVALFCCWERDC
jgi:hypothetical protein